MHATQRGIAGSMECPGKARMETCQIAHAPATSSEGNKKQCDRPGLYDTDGLSLREKLESQWGCHRQFIPCKKIGGLGDKAIITRHPMRSTYLASHKQGKATTLFFTHPRDSVRLSFRPRKILEDKRLRACILIGQSLFP